MGEPPRLPDTLCTGPWNSGCPYTYAALPHRKPAAKPGEPGAARGNPISRKLPSPRSKPPSIVPLYTCFCSLSFSFFPQLHKGPGRRAFLCPQSRRGHIPNTELAAWKDARRLAFCRIPSVDIVELEVEDTHRIPLLNPHLQKLIDNTAAAQHPLEVLQGFRRGIR